MPLDKDTHLIAETYDPKLGPAAVNPQPRRCYVVLYHISEQAYHSVGGVYLDEQKTRDGIRQIISEIVDDVAADGDLPEINQQMLEEVGFTRDAAFIYMNPDHKTPIPSRIDVMDHTCIIVEGGRLYV